MPILSGSASIMASEPDLRCPMTLLPFVEAYTSKVCKHTFKKSAIIEAFTTAPAFPDVNDAGKRIMVKKVVCPMTSCEEKSRATDFFDDEAIMRRLDRSRQTDGPSAPTYSELWKTADFLRMPRLQNFVMTRLSGEYKNEDFKGTRKYDFLPLINPCYENTEPGSILREWVVELFEDGFAKLVNNPRADLRENCCYDFLLDYARRMDLKQKPSKSVERMEFLVSEAVEVEDDDSEDELPHESAIIGAIKASKSPAPEVETPATPSVEQNA